MDASRFADVVRSLTAAGSRRHALAATLGGALGLFGLAHADDGAAKRRRKCHTCGPCKRCKKGACKSIATGTLCAGGYCQGGRCIPSFCAGKDHCVVDSFCHRTGSGAFCNCFVTAGSGVPFCGQEGYGSSCADCQPGDTCVKCGDGAFCERPCGDPADPL